MPESATLKLPLGPLMVDVRGETLGGDELDFLRHPAVGAVILFARNYRGKAQARALVDEIKAIRSPALLVAVDQEGGRVQRLKTEFHPLPAAGRLGELYDRDAALGMAMAETAGRLMALEVLAIGVDFSFAPVLDCRNPRSLVIGDRAFHREPTALCALAGAYITGMNRAGMVATGKHFPGHGGVSADSHEELPVDTRTFAELEKRDLLPFKQLAHRLGGIMTAHVLFHSIHEHLPAYASFWLKAILRKKLHFDGVIFSDDLSMKGAGMADGAAIKSAAALAAGCDLALICNAPADARRAADKLVDGYSVNQARLLAMQATASHASDLAETAPMAAALAAALAK